MSTAKQIPVTPITEPYSLEAEKAVLGALITTPAKLPEVQNILKAPDFFIVRHQYIWTALDNLGKRGEPVDYVTVAAELKQMDKLDEIELPYLTSLISEAPNSFDAPMYAQFVKRFSLRRQILAASDKTRKLALDANLSVEEVNAQVEGLFQAITKQELSKPEIDWKDLVSQQFDAMELLMKQRKDGMALTGISTGFKDLDAVLGGLQKTDLLILAGRPGMGKSAAATSMAINVLLAGKRVGLFSLEMGKEQVIQRMAAQHGGINLQYLRNGNLSPEDWSRYVSAAGAMSQWKFHLDDTGSLTVPAFRAQVMRWFDRYGALDLLIVDYLQLMRGGDGFAQSNKDGTREREISYISEELKAVAKEYNVPVLALAQLSRAVESRADKRPNLADLRESGAIEQNADVVMFIYRDEYYNVNTAFPNQAEIIIAKHRNGPTGTKYLYFEKTQTRFMNAAVRQVDLRSDTPSVTHIVKAQPKGE